MSSTTLAQLGIEIKTSGVVETKAALDRLTDAAKKAQEATKDLNKTSEDSEKANKKVSLSMELMISKLTETGAVYNARKMQMQGYANHEIALIDLLIKKNNAHAEALKVNAQIEKKILDDKKKIQDSLAKAEHDAYAQRTNALKIYNDAILKATKSTEEYNAIKRAEKLTLDGLTQAEIKHIQQLESERKSTDELALANKRLSESIKSVATAKKDSRPTGSSVGFNSGLSQQPYKPPVDSEALKKALKEADIIARNNIREKYTNSTLIRGMSNASSSGSISLTAGMSQSGATAAALQAQTRAAEEAAKSQANLGQSTQSTGSHFNELNRILAKTHDMLIRMAAYRAINIIGSLPGDILDVNMRMETLRVQLEGITGSAKDGMAVFDKMVKLDFKTPFDLEGLTKTWIMLKNFGLEPTEKVMSALTNSVARLGGGTSELIGIGRQLAQAWSKDKLQLVDMRPMIERGLPVLNMLSERLKVSTGDILDMSKAGTLNRDVMTLLIDEMEKWGKGQALRQMDTMRGALSNITSGWMQLQDAFLTDKGGKNVASIFKVIGDTLFFLRDNINSVIVVFELLAGLLAVKLVASLIASVAANRAAAVAATENAVASLMLSQNISKVTAAELLRTSAMAAGASSATLATTAMRGLNIAMAAYATYVIGNAIVDHFDSVKVAIVAAGTALEKFALTRKYVMESRKVSGDEQIALDEKYYKELDSLDSVGFRATRSILNRDKEIEDAKAISEATNKQAKDMEALNAAMEESSNISKVALGAKLKGLELASSYQKTVNDQALNDNARLHENNKINDKNYIDSKLSLTKSMQDYNNNILQDQQKQVKEALEKEIKAEKDAHEKRKSIQTEAEKIPGYVSEKKVGEFKLDDTAIKLQEQLDEINNKIKTSTITNVEDLNKINDESLKLREEAQKKSLDNKLSDIDGAAKAEQEIIKGNISEIDLLYATQQISEQKHLDDTFAIKSSLIEKEKNLLQGRIDLIENSSLSDEEALKKINPLQEQYNSLIGNGVDLKNKYAADSYKLHVQEHDQLEQERIKYLELTGQIEEAIQAKRDLAVEKVGIKVPYKPTELQTIQIKNIDIDSSNQLIDSAARQRDALLEISNAYKDIGNNASTALAAQLGGFQPLLGALDEMIKGSKAVQKERNKIADDTEKANKIKDPAAKEKALHIEQLKTIALDKAELAQNLTNASLIAGSVSKMFGEKTAAAKAFHAIEVGLSAASMAMKAAEIAMELKSTLVSVVSGAAKFFAQSGWAGFAGVAAMLAVLGGLGYAASSSDSISVPVPESPDSGTVLGDSTAKSESINNTYELLKDIHAEEYAELRGINQGVASLSSGITNVITRLFQAGGLADYTGKTGKEYNLKPITMIDPVSKWLAGFLVGGLFGTTKKKVTGTGIATGATSIADIMAGGNLSASQYTTIETTKKSWFSKKTSYQDVFSALDDDTQKALDGVFKSMGDTMFSVAKAFGGDLKDKVTAYIIPAMKIDLTGLSGEDAAKKLNNVISTALDTMADTVFGDIIGQYQQLGEGMLETAIRIVAEVAVVKDALGKSGLSIANNAIAISDALVQATGGLKEFQAAFDKYYQKFYTDAERNLYLQKSLASQLSDVNLILPKTRMGYRDLIESLNINNKADQSRYSLLIKLSDAADEYYSVLDDGISKSIDNLKSLLSKLRSALASTVIETTDLLQQNRYNAQQILKNALSISRSGGSIENIPGLNKALDDISKPSEELYSTFLDYARDQGQTGNVISQLADYVDNQISIAEQQLNAIKDTTAAVLSVNGSISNLSASLGVKNNTSQSTTLSTIQGFNSFDVGTNYVESDRWAMIHRGERIMPAADNEQLLMRLSNPNISNKELIEEIRELRRTVASQQSSLNDIAMTNKKTSDILINVTMDGQSVLTTPA